MANKLTFEQKSSTTDGFHSKKVNPPPVRSGVSYINAEDEDQMVCEFQICFFFVPLFYNLFVQEIYGYAPNLAKIILTWTLIVLTGGILRLLFHWKPHWMLLCTHNLCTLENAKKVLLIVCTIKPNLRIIFFFSLAPRFFSPFVFRTIFYRNIRKMLFAFQMIVYRIIWMIAHSKKVVLPCLG